ncbi:hypothetical protein AVEN_145393-2 [Araneus ventricosus]|uniref:Uncharacterized protein n=1 Tax=Araneus ventricosus TaxID=182803 RepID=A0A4Y2MDS5_ARAVE|nr:hypothetical protein AVEN_145393-2 [Araneus ventricosus]
MIKHFMQKCPVNYALVRPVICIDPQVMAGYPEKAQEKMKKLRYEVTEERNKRRIQEHREETKNFNQFWAGTEYAPSALSSGYSFEVDSKTTPWTINAACSNPVLADPIVKNKIAILAKRREKEHKLKSKLKELCLESKEEDLKIKFNDGHSVDLQTMSEDEKFIRKCQMHLLPLKENNKEYEPKLEALKKELHNKRACYLPSPRNVEPETLAFLIRERFDTLASWLVNGRIREEMALRSFESTDPVPNKEVGNDKSLLQEKDGQFQSQEELMKKDLEKPCPKLPVTDLKREKIASQSSESTDSLPSEEVEKDSSLDEDDIEIISKNETESIPSDLSFSPPLPPKNRFKFGPKPLRLSSLIRKKGDRKPPHSPRNSSGIGESESQESSFSSAVSSGSNTEMKENPSFNKQAGQESSNKCLGGSKDESQGSNPTVALRSSFSKYLEKNPKNEWLAPLKMSEQLLPAGNGSKERVVVQRVVPIFVQELDQWLPREPNQKMASDWLYPAHM